ncbi:MAG: PEP-CTERM sorting domain-containing protein [Caulobacteraceae bacterium]
MLAAGGAAAAGSAAGAATVYTDTFDVSAIQFAEPLATSDPLNDQFSFGLPANVVKGGNIGAYFSAVGPTAAIGEETATPGLPSRSEIFDSQSLFIIAAAGKSLALNDNLASEPYVHLAFTSGGTLYLGTATLGPDPNTGYNTELDTIEFEAAPVPEPAPEPAAWALLVAGVGLAGSGLRRRRARLQAA